MPKKFNLFWFWPIHIFYRGKHVLILTISMQTWRFLLKRVWSAGAPRIFAPARTPQKPQIFGKGIFAVLLYNAKEQVLLLPNCPPIRSYLSWLHEPSRPVLPGIERVFKNSNSPNSGRAASGTNNAKIPTAPDQKQKNQN